MRHPKPKGKSIGGTGITKEKYLVRLGKYAEFRKYQVLYKMAPRERPEISQRALEAVRELGYTDITDKAFCERWKISKDCPVRYRRENREFWEKFYDEIILDQRDSLPIVMTMLARHDPASWLKLAFTSKVKELSLKPGDGSGSEGVGVSLTDAQELLGGAFIVEHPRQKRLKEVKE
jgi:hypothetical protein